MRHQKKSDEGVAVLEGVSKKEAEQWRDAVARERDMLFRQNWKNRRQSVSLRSRSQEESFRFIVEWCEEAPELVEREMERSRLDRLLDLGLDVNTPENQAGRKRRILRP
jgi:hypothetical protein